MKKNQRNPAIDAVKNESDNKDQVKSKGKNQEKIPQEDIGAMKIGKAHGMNDDRPLISTKESNRG